MLSSISRLMRRPSIGFTPGVDANGNPRNHGRSLHHIYIFPVADNDFPELWSEATSHFTLVYRHVPNNTQNVDLIFDGGERGRSHLTARPAVAPDVKRSAAAHITCPNHWTDLNNWLHRPLEKGDSWPSRVNNQWKQFGCAPNDPINTAFMQAAPIFTNMLYDLFRSVSQYFQEVPADEIDPTPPPSPDAFDRNIPPNHRDLNVIPDIDLVFGHEAVEAPRNASAPPPPPAEDPPPYSEHDEL